ncbi:hypothetical protein [Parvibaculum sp.]|uniref:hypothetical protein n=1 Tax=Parvibaculum sp. TaxID=2024848 RepID=UPI0025E7D57C|nr:hypothetical protein [Parvibaculum sp.]
MAKAQFHKNQRVYVRPVGTWAVIERLVPQWVKDMDEPLRINYDVGLGREFRANELETEETEALTHLDPNMEEWHVQRVPNKWRSDSESANHPVPGTHPVIVTGGHEGGGWRVPGIEYDLYPDRCEMQARIMAASPQFMVLLQHLIEVARNNPENLPDDVMDIANDAAATLAKVLRQGVVEEEGGAGQPASSRPS